MKKPADATLAITADYRQFVEELKERVSSARLSAARRINHEMIVLYWDIGRGIVEKQKALGWGESVVEMVAGDLRAEFPEMRGFSAQNVWRMKQFYIAHSSDESLSQLVRELKRMPKSRASDFLRQPVAELGGVEVQAHPAPEFLSQAVRELVAAAPWGHHANVLAKLSDPVARLWYLRATARFGWSRNVLLNQIKAGACERAVTEKKTPNFDLALPEHFAEQADEMLKSSSNLEFLGLRRAVRERELEDRLITRLQSFLLELGYGFCFVGPPAPDRPREEGVFHRSPVYHRFLKALVAFVPPLHPAAPLSASSAPPRQRPHPFPSQNLCGSAGVRAASVASLRPRASVVTCVLVEACELISQAGWLQERQPSNFEFSSERTRVSPRKNPRDDSDQRTSRH